MKKLLAIIVLGLLFSGNASAFILKHKDLVIMSHPGNYKEVMGGFIRNAFAAAEFYCAERGKKTYHRLNDIVHRKTALGFTRDNSVRLFCAKNDKEAISLISDVTFAATSLAGIQFSNSSRKKYYTSLLKKFAKNKLFKEDILRFEIKTQDEIIFAKRRIGTERIIKYDNTFTKRTARMEKQKKKHEFERQKREDKINQENRQNSHDGNYHRRSVTSIYIATLRSKYLALVLLESSNR